MTDIDRLRLVATVVRTRSIHETARAHGVAQSTVTRAVAAAESLVGFELFARSTNGSHPRPEAAPPISEMRVDDPVAAVVAGEADFAVIPMGTAIPDDLVWQCVRAVRGGGTALVHRHTESPQVTAFLRMIG